MTDFDQGYRDADDYFGSEPDQVLVDHLDLLDAGRPVLDLGVGQGRIALYLARRGFDVHGIDPSPVGVEQVAAAAREEGLSLTLEVCTYEAFRPGVDSYGAVLAFGLLPILSRETLPVFVDRIQRWTSPGSLAVVTAFTTGAGESRERLYLEPGELRGLLPGFEVLHYREGLSPEHRHGDGPLHRHAKAEAVFRRA